MDNHEDILLTMHLICYCLLKGKNNQHHIWHQHHKNNPWKDVKEIGNTSCPWGEKLDSWGQKGFPLLLLNFTS